jgi:ribose 5-phosphate isomerase A
VQTAKKAAIAKALEEVRDVRIVGIGSGTTLELLIPQLAKLVKAKNLKLKVIPTSLQIESAIAKTGLTIVSPNDVSQIDLVLDGADQVETQTLNLIKGGGAALTKEKIVDCTARRLIIVVDERKITSRLGSGQAVPVEVIPFARRLVMGRLNELGGKPELRRSKGSGPVITDNDNFVIDVDFGLIKDAHALDRQLKLIPGVVETGLFLNLTDRVYTGLKNGKVKVLESR